MAHEEPSKGGSYMRNADGSLTLLERTGAAEMRDKRETEQPVAGAPVEAVTLSSIAPAGVAAPGQE